MHGMKRPYCQRILPLVYDDSLSYYEVLCKIISVLNEFTSNAEEMIQEILDDMGLGDNVRFRNVLNVKDYGAKGDGITDDRLTIQAALNAAHDAGGGIVFVPAGHYIVSKCIIVGDNCFLVGCGAGSVIELTDLQPFWGTAIGIVGSNDGCMNLKVLYAEDPSVTKPVVIGAAWGAVGITNCDYYTAVSQSNAGSKNPISNIIVSDLYTVGFYALQVEPVNVASNVLYKNIYAPGGMVSVQGGTMYETAHGHLYNVVCDNIVCDFFRILGGNYTEGVNITNLHTHYFYSNANDVHLENFTADCSTTSVFDGSSLPINGHCCQFLNYDVPEGSEIHRSSASNGKIIGNNSDAVQVGLAVVQLSKWLFENVNVKGFTRRNIAGAAGSDTIFIACDAAQAGITNSPTGTGVNNNMGLTFTEYNDSWSSVYTDTPGEITFTDPYVATGADIANSYIVKNGNIIYGNVACRKPEGYVALQDEVCRLPYKPARTIYCTGFMADITQDDSEYYPSVAILKIDTNGVVTLIHNARKSPGGHHYNALYFSFTYSKIHPEV